MRAAVVTVAAAVLILSSARVDAHKPILSKYTYTEDVFPIVSQHCGMCHAAGGVAPMSLLTYKDAFPWAESIRAELTASHMPPWYAESGYGDLKNPHRLSPRELDILLTWATGGTPQGPARKAPAPLVKNGWKLGKPDLILQMPAPFTLAADKNEDTQEFVLQPAGAADRWVKAVDLQPGTPAIVRSASIYTKPTSGTETNVLALWLPDESPVTVPDAAFRWPAGSDLRLRIHYRKTWNYDDKAVTDRSTVGVYLSERPALKEVHSVAISGESVVLDHDVQALSVRAEAGAEDKKIRVEAVKPDGSRVPMISLITRRGWERRYWLARPLLLPRGTRIQISGEAKARVWIDVLAPNN